MKSIKPYFLFFASIFFSLNIFAQQTGKIKVILLGTFHYGITSDKGRTNLDDLFSPKRQQELEMMATAIVKNKVDKIFIEYPFSKQSLLDSELAVYKNKTITDTFTLRDEIYQIAFRAAKMNNDIKIEAADVKQELPYDKMDAYEKAHATDSISSYPFFDMDYPFKKTSKKLSDITLPEYYIRLNSLYERQRNQFDYMHYALSYGKANDYTGVEYTTSWYNRNLKIFTNILRDIDPKKDKVILVLFGSSHTNTMRQFFELHPSFEIVEVDSLFKN